MLREWWKYSARAMSSEKTFPIKSKALQHHYLSCRCSLSLGGNQNTIKWKYLINNNFSALAFSPRRAFSCHQISISVKLVCQSRSRTSGYVAHKEHPKNKVQQILGLRLYINKSATHSFNHKQVMKINVSAGANPINQFESVLVVLWRNRPALLLKP